MNITLYAALMVFITIAALAAHQTLIALLASALLMAGLFLYRYQNHTAVREWMEKYF